MASHRSKKSARKRTPPEPMTDAMVRNELRRAGKAIGALADLMLEVFDGVTWRLKRGEPGWGDLGKAALHLRSMQRALISKHLRSPSPKEVARSAEAARTLRAALNRLERSRALHAVDDWNTRDYIAKGYFQALTMLQKRARERRLGHGTSLPTFKELGGQLGRLPSVPRAPNARNSERITKHLERLDAYAKRGKVPISTTAKAITGILHGVTTNAVNEALAGFARESKGQRRDRHVAGPDEVDAGKKPTST